MSCEYELRNILFNIPKMKTLILITSSLLLTACNPISPAPQNVPEAPPTIGFDSYNPTATAHLSTALSRTGKVTCIVNNREYALTDEESGVLSALLTGAQSSTPLCAPANCFYLNLLTADGTWLMSLPVQQTPEGIVLLYLKLQGNKAGAPLQGWWMNVSSRLGL